MNCQKAIELLAEYGSGEPDRRAGWRFRLHLWCCRNCRNYLATYKTTVQLEKSAYSSSENDSPTVPKKLLSQIMTAIRRT